MRTAWALWSSRVEMYSEPDLIEVFAKKETAEAARVGLIGKPRYRGSGVLWEDDEDFPDLYVRPLEIR